MMMIMKCGDGSVRRDGKKITESITIHTGAMICVEAA
jgi:hypothetical protein